MNPGRNAVAAPGDPGTRAAGASTLTGVFEASVRAYGSREAVVDRTRSLTYAELDRESSALAVRLAAAGVTRGTRVGLLLDRRAEIVVAILGVLKAGGTYVPLDPAYPEHRLAYMLADSGVRTLVGDLALVPPTMPDGIESIPLPAPGAAPARVRPQDGVPAPDDVRPGDGGLPPHGGPRDDAPDRRPVPAPCTAPSAPGGPARPEDAAYVIYTSGSTGRPKGCLVSHANVVALLRAALPLLDAGPDDRWSLFHSYNFDFSVWEMWGALALGGAVAVTPGATARSPRAFLDFLREQRVTVLNQVPSVFRYLAAACAEQGGVPQALRCVVFGGEAVDLDVLRDFSALAGARAPRLVNMYGITETTVHATFKELTDEDLAGRGGSPIGRPLPHLSITLADAEGRPVPDGEAGEMWVSGAGVALGYLGRPELTAERFVTRDGVRHYRSGDLAARLPDGGLDYRGRVDQQVKLRGFRIELGEVEAAVRGCAGIRDAAAVVIRTKDGEPLLAAAYTSAGDPGVREIRQRVRAVLPAYMVPDRYIAVQALPLTPSGKLDRAELVRTCEDLTLRSRRGGARR